MEDNQRKHEFIRQQNALKYRQLEYQKEMEECTFTPMLNRQTTTSRILDHKLN